MLPASYNTIQYSTSLLFPCREICPLHKTFNTFNNKTSTAQRNMDLKPAQMQEKSLTITVYTHTHARTHAPRSPHTLFFWLINRLKHSINYNKTKFLKQQNTKIETLKHARHARTHRYLKSLLHSHRHG